LAERHGKPVAVNLPNGDEQTTTVFIPPRGWTAERLEGYVGGMSAELEAAFGPVGSVRRVS
jgi:hypothetical protein